nr:hypothetical protein [Tanacetum cinerariifolium]
MFHKRTKHIDVRYHWIRDAIEDSMFELNKVHTDDNASDMLTKAVAREKLKICCSIITGSEGDKGGSSMIDFSSPYYLHPSDSLKQLSVNEKSETSSSEYKSWMRCDAMIKGWLTTAMEKGIRVSVKYANTSSEIWSDLKERFGKEGPMNLRRRSSLHVKKAVAFRPTTPVSGPDLSNKTRSYLRDGLSHGSRRREAKGHIAREAVPEPAIFKAFQRRDNNFRSSKEKYIAKKEKENKQNDECTFCKKMVTNKKGVSN